jgi:hypothetical protein
LSFEITRLTNTLFAELRYLSRMARRRAADFSPRLPAKRRV